MSASDVVYAVTALLEMGGDEALSLDGSAPVVVGGQSEGPVAAEEEGGQGEVS